MGNSPHHKFYFRVVEILQLAKSQVVRNINRTMVLAYYGTGRMIFGEDQQGQYRAEYGKQLIKELSSKFTLEFGGFSDRDIEQMQQFYLLYRILQTPSAQSKNTKSKRFLNYYF